MKGLCVISFGSSYKEGLKTLDLMYQDIKKSFPDRRPYRAFTSQTIRKLLKQGNKEVKSVSQIMKQMIDEGVDDVIIVPLFMIEGQSYHQMYDEVLSYKNQFKYFAIGDVLLKTPYDYQLVVEAFRTYLKSHQIEEIVIGMGHGSDLIVSQSYRELHHLFRKEKENQVYIATLMSQPTLDEVIHCLQGHHQSVCLIPFMLVSGYHISQDMKQIWVPKLQQAGFKVTVLQHSLGEIPEIRAIFIAHAKCCEKVRA